MGGILWYEPVQRVLQAAQAATAADGEKLDLGGKYASVSLQVTGTMTDSTITFEGSIDGVNWVSVKGLNFATGEAETATGANAGLWVVPVVGLNYFRARKSGSGTTAVTVTAVATAAPTPAIQINVAAI